MKLRKLMVCIFDFVMYNKEKRKARCHCTIVPRESAYTNATTIPLILVSWLPSAKTVLVSRYEIIKQFLIYCSSIGASSS